MGRALTGKLLDKWNKVVSGFKGVKMSIPRCLFWSVDNVSSRCSLHWFCDASSGVYAAVVYVKVESESGNCVNFIVSKTRVAPIDKQTIPKLELLSVLLLANLMMTICSALEKDLTIALVTYYTDSKVSLCWIKGVKKEWKLFVRNRVNTIRKLTSVG